MSYKAGNIIAFLDSLMNSVLYRDKYDELSDHVAKGLNVYQAFSGCRADDLVECDILYALANSNLMNRYNSTTCIKQTMTWWRGAYIALIAVSGVLMVGSFAMYTVSSRKKKEESEAQ